MISGSSRIEKRAPISNNGTRELAPMRYHACDTAVWRTQLPGRAHAMRSSHQN
ncbi:hypothetical protein I553_7451 [Mycobacterium xenopi 4042]|uniref:Uncharacterized protein n=1 Tax=Mycobacterium xenopi 4042 TaxID=1299334 RepID=X8E912_MYCXE|nr:hypothetical protein I553_7451 [Mycobacterium xenopi 4042]